MVSSWSLPSNSDFIPVATDYFQLRQRFRSVVALTGGELEIHPISPLGPRGEELTVDVGIWGSKKPSRILLHISGTHGVEGYLGSAIQSSFLRDEYSSRQLESVAGKQALIMVHGLNPWGMAYLRRVNEKNIDLNRNFLPFNRSDHPLPQDPPEYRDLNILLNPQLPPSRIDPFPLQALRLIAKYGMPTLKQAIGGGQSNFPLGLYYRGQVETESISILKDILRTYLTGAELVVALEVHSGLGQWAQESIFWPHPSSHPFSKWLAAHAELPLIPDIVESGIGFASPGTLQLGVPSLFPETMVVWLLQEFGAYSPLRTLIALRRENQHQHWGGGSINHWSKAKLVRAFLPNSKDWQQRCLARGKNLLCTGLKLLNTNPPSTKD